MKKEISLSSPWLWFLLGVGVILIPVVLNWVLQWTVPACTEVIGGARSTEVWLVFWGSFLAAIGSFAMAILTFITSREDRRKSFLQNKLNYLLSEYSTIEMEIQENERVHSITYLLSNIPDDSSADVFKGKTRNALREWFLKLTQCSSSAIKYKRYPFALQYINTLGSINKKCLELNEYIRINLEKDADFNYQKLLTIISESEVDIILLMRDGFELLENYFNYIQGRSREIE